MKVNLVLHTDGKGYWSCKTPRAVTITKIYINYYDGKQRFGELCAKFDPEDWNVEVAGLIYTDDKWIKEFLAILEFMGVPTKDLECISYSEQGLQGKDYVSLDIRDAFFDCDFGKQLLKEFNERK